MDKRIAIFLFLLFKLLLIRLFLFYTTKPVYKSGDFINFETQVYSSPKFSQNYQSFSVQTPAGDTIFIDVPINAEYSYGDDIQVSGNLEIKLLRNNYKLLFMNYPKIVLVKSRENKLLAAVNSVRQKLISEFEHNLPNNSSGLLLGIVLG